MLTEPFQVLRAEAQRGPAEPGQRLVIAGATGVLGNEVLRRLIGLGRFESTQVLAREPMTVGLSRVATTVVPSDLSDDWPPCAADTGVILFDPPRLFHDRERALWTPQPEHLPALARWLHRSGVSTVAVVLSHEQGRLPEALKRGLASLDEHAVAALGFARLLIIRSAQEAARAKGQSSPVRLAHWMLSSFKYMVPSADQPVRAAKVAEFVAAALQLAPPGIHIAAPETVRQAAQGDAHDTVRQWLGL